MQTTRPTRSRVVISERWSVVRHGLTGLLSARNEIVAGVGSPAELLPFLADRDIDLAVVGDGPDVQLRTTVASLLRIDSGLSVVVLCEDIGAELLRDLLRDGVRAVLSKSVADDDLLDGVDRALAGERVIDQRFLPLLYGGDLERTDASEVVQSVLSPRELEVLGQLARGSTNQEIADVLVVGLSTIKTHLARIYTKLDVDDRHQAVGRALELGLLK